MAITRDRAVDILAQIIYTEENMMRANQYLASRGLDPAKMDMPCAFTNGDVSQFNILSEVYPPYIFTDSLFIPTRDPFNHEIIKLAGFDIRYLGTASYRTRYQKIKRDEQTVLIYGLHRIMQEIQTYSRDTPLIVTEGAIDCESFQHLAIPHMRIAPLTSRSDWWWTLFLYGLSGNVCLAYDNDKDGLKAAAAILSNADFNQTVRKGFRNLTYRGEDPNKGLTTMGAFSFNQLLTLQLQQG